MQELKDAEERKAKPAQANDESDPQSQAADDGNTQADQPPPPPSEDPKPETPLSSQFFSVSDIEEELEQNLLPFEPATDEE